MNMVLEVDEGEQWVDYEIRVPRTPMSTRIMVPPDDYKQQEKEVDMAIRRALRRFKLSNPVSSVSVTDLYITRKEDVGLQMLPTYVVKVSFTEKGVEIQP